MLEKISAAQMNTVLVKAASALRSQQSEISSLKEKLAAKDRREHAEKIAHVALDKGIMGEEEAKDYAEQLASGGEDLKMVEDFIGRTANGVSLGKLEKTASAEQNGGSSQVDALTSFLLSSEHAG